MTTLAEAPPQPVIIDGLDSAQRRIAQMYAAIEEAQRRRNLQEQGPYASGRLVTALDIYCAGQMAIRGALPRSNTL